MRRPDRADLLFLAAAAWAGLMLLGLGAGLTFFSDEWAFIESRALGDPTAWFEPHNEHWATLPILVYRALVETVGLGSYIPYLFVLVALHLTVASLVYILVRRSSGTWSALAVALVVLFLGSGFENLYWAFQIGFVGALAAGLGAIAVFDAVPLTTRRAVIGASLLVASLATAGGPGLICCVAVGIELLLDPRRRRAACVLAIPAVTYGVWFLLIGRVGVESRRGLFSLGGLDDVPPMIFTGFPAVIGTFTGTGTALGSVALVVVLVAAVGWSIWRRHIELAPRFVACVLAVATLYGLIAIARSFAGENIANLTRYTYVSASLFIVGLAAQVGRPSMESRNARRIWQVGGAALLTLALIWNVQLLFLGRDLFAERAELTRAFVTVALERPLPATTDPDRTLVIVPSPNALARIVEAYGSPLTERLVPWAVGPIGAEVLARARQVLAEGAEIPLPSESDESP